MFKLNSTLKVCVCVCVCVCKVRSDNVDVVLLNMKAPFILLFTRCYYYYVHY
jgi:hypothetical protein